jgi:hypothetical protein
MYITVGTVLADLSDPYFADTVLIELRERIAEWLSHPACTQEQAAQMCNWLYLHAAFRQHPPMESCQAWRAMVIAAGLLPPGASLVDRDGLWRVM